jgi:hypothetical protein
MAKKQLGVAPSGATDAVTKSYVDRKQTINVLDYISDPTNTATHSAGFQAAIDAATATNGPGVVTIPSGRWCVEGLNIPAMKSLIIQGQGHNTVVTGTNSNTTDPGTRLHRLGTQPIFNLVAAPGFINNNNGLSVGTIADYTNRVRDVQIRDLTMINDNASATSALLYIRGALECNFSRITMHNTAGYNASAGAPLIDARALTDSVFNECVFFGGGSWDGTIGAVRLLGTDGFSYAACWELQFSNCQWTSYFGPAIEIGNAVPDGAVNTQRNYNILFTNIKLESLFTTSPHIKVISCSNLQLQNVYFANAYTADSIIDLYRGSGCWGSIGFLQTLISNYVVPSAYLRVRTEFANVGLNVRVYSSVPTDANIVTLDNPADSSNDIQISTQGFGLINGTNSQSRYIRSGSVVQQVTSGTAVCQYVFSKTGRTQWILGNPTNSSGTLEEFYVDALDSAGHRGRFLTLRSYGADPTANVKTAIFGAALHLSGGDTNAWINFPTQVATPGNYNGIQLYAKDNGGGRRQLALGNDGGTASFVETRGIATTVTSSSLTVNSDVITNQTVSALASSMTINAPTGTPTSGQRLNLVIKDDETSRALTWNAAWSGVGVDLPTATVAGKWLVVQAIYNSTTSKWFVIHARTESDSIITALSTSTLSNKTLSIPKIDVLRDTATGSSVMQFGTNGTSGNYLYLQASSGNPNLSVVGTSGTDVSLTVAPKGAGTLAIFSATGLTPTLEARGADANHNLNLVSKGTTGKVQVNGAEASRRTIQTVTTSTTLLANGDYVVFIGASGAPILPTATNNTGRYTFKNIDIVARTISTTSFQTIDGSTTLTVPPGSSVDIIADGTGSWRII